MNDLASWGIAEWGFALAVLGFVGGVLGSLAKWHAAKKGLRAEILDLLRKLDALSHPVLEKATAYEGPEAQALQRVLAALPSLSDYRQTIRGLGLFTTSRRQLEVYLDALEEAELSFAKLLPKIERLLEQETVSGAEER